MSRTTERFFAHSNPNAGPEEYERLEDHLRLVAEGDGELPGAAGFAAAFGAAEEGRVLGCWSIAPSRERGLKRQSAYQAAR